MISRLFSTIVLLLLTLSVVGTQTATAGQIRVLASIKPIQLIAQDMLGDLAHVDVLLPSGSSPHHYSLKPSSIGQIHDADLFIWGGPGLELFLTKTVSQLERPALGLLEDDDDHHPANPETENVDAAHSDDAGGHEDEHHHDGADPHFWMAPDRALAAADRIKDRLMVLYPEEAAIYQQAYDDFAARLSHTDQLLQQQLKSISATGFYVFHDAFSSFVEHYQLNQLGYFTVDPGRKPGARRLSEIRKALETNKAHCVFVEPQFKAPVVDSLIRGLNIRVGRLDPLAVEIEAARGGYSKYLQSLADSFTNCLSGE